MTQKLKLAVLISGNGTNLQAIIDACQQNSISAEVVFVASNKEQAFGLQRAQKAKIPTFILNQKNWAGQLLEILKQNSVDLICLAGFMKLLPADFVARFPNKIINVHPSLLPAFPGINAQQQALDHKVKTTGVTMHFVDAGLDSGPIILQVPVDVQPDDTLESLRARLSKEEHRLYLETIQLIATSRLQIQGQRVFITAK